MSEQNCPWCGEGTWNGVHCLTCGAHGKDVRSRHLYCPRCGSGPLINDAHFDGETCSDCGRALTDAEREAIG